MVYTVPKSRYYIGLKSRYYMIAKIDCTAAGRSDVTDLAIRDDVNQLSIRSNEAAGGGSCCSVGCTLSHVSGLCGAQFLQSFLFLPLCAHGISDGTGRRHNPEQEDRNTGAISQIQNTHQKL